MEAKLKDVTLLLARICDSQQSIPGWAAFSIVASIVVTSIVDPPVTTPGMLPILQAPADDNHTVTTVVNRFIKITSKLSQPYTVIAMNQPLYSKTKELVWANQHRYKDVVIHGEYWPDRYLGGVRFICRG